MSHRSMVIRNILPQASFYAAFCVQTVFQVLYLTNQGYSTLQIGMIVAGANLLGALLQIWTGRLADSAKGGSVKTILFAEGLIMALSMVPILLGVKKVGVVVGCFVIANLLGQAIQGPLTAVPVAFETAGYPVRFNVVRGMGSVSYGIASVLFGFYFNRAPITTLPLLLFLCVLFFTLLVIAIPTVPVEREQLHSDRITRTGRRSEHFFKTYAVLIPIMVGFTVLFAGHIIINLYMSLFVTSLGGHPSDAGIAVAIAIIMEVASFMVYARIRKHVPDRVLLLCSALFFTIKAFIFSRAEGMTLIYLSQALQFFGFGFFLSGLVYFIARIVAPEDLVQGQSVPTMIMSFGGALGAGLGGWAIDVFELHPMMHITALVSALGTIIAVYGIWNATKKIQFSPLAQDEYNESNTQRRCHDTLRKRIFKCFRRIAGSRLL